MSILCWHDRAKANSEEKKSLLHCFVDPVLMIIKFMLLCGNYPIYYPGKTVTWYFCLLLLLAIASNNSPIKKPSRPVEAAEDVEVIESIIYLLPCKCNAWCEDDVMCNRSIQLVEA